MNKKILIPIIAIISFLSGVNSTAREVNANDLSTSSVVSTSSVSTESSVVTSSSIEESSSFTSSSEIVNSSTETPVITEDELKDFFNGILDDEQLKDFFMGILGEELGGMIEDLIFNFSISSLLSVLVIVVFQLYSRHKDKGSQTELKKSTDRLENTVETAVEEMDYVFENHSETIKKMAKDYEEKIELVTNAFKNEIEGFRGLLNIEINEKNQLIKENKELMKKYEELANRVLLSNNEIASSLKNYSKVDDKINAVLNSMEAMASTQDNVKQGITEKVKSIVKGVK